MEVFDVILWVVVIVFTFWAIKRIRENFTLSMPKALGGKEILKVGSHSLHITEKEIVSLTPFTCPLEKPDLDAGLCYEKCKKGFRGVGPVCWAESFNRGVGTPIGLEPCPAGWTNDGLICREPITSTMNPCPQGSRDVAGTCWGPTGQICGDDCSKGWDGCRRRGLFGMCLGGCREGCSSIDGITKHLHQRDLKVSGGRLLGRLDKGGVCPNVDPGGPAENTEKLDGLCYKKCPADKPYHIPGMPYLCYAGGDLSYGRGVGKVPSLFRALGKYPIL